MPRKSRKLVEPEAPPESTEKPAEGWEAYLALQQQDIQGGALRRAVLGEPTEATQRRGRKAGAGHLKIVFEPPVGVDPWTFDEAEEEVED